MGIHLLKRDGFEEDFTSIAVAFLLATFFAASFLAFEPPLVSDRLLFAALPFVIPAPPLDPFPAILSGFR
jgi:hypothetical protein